MTFANEHVLKCCVRYWISQLDFFIGLSQKHCAWLGFANAKSWTESISYMVRRLVSQVSVDECRKWKKFNCLMLSWLSQVSTVQWQDSLQKSRVSCVEECQTESIVICVDDWPSANMLSVIVYCFTAQSVDNGFEINQHELQNLLKIYQK